VAALLDCRRTLACGSNLRYYAKIREVQKIIAKFYFMCYIVKCLYSNLMLVYEVVWDDVEHLIKTLDRSFGNLSHSTYTIKG
jgi:hypothetical protein